MGVGSVVWISNQPPVRPDAHGAQSHVHVGEHDGAQAHPCPEHVAPVEATRATPCLVAERSFRGLVEKSTKEVAQRVAAKRVAGKEDDIYREHYGPKADAECRLSRRRVGKPQCFPNVVCEKNKK